MNRDRSDSVVKTLFKLIKVLISGNEVERHRVRLEFARLCANLFGDHYLGDGYKRWREDKDFLDAYKLLVPRNPYSQERKYTLREFIKLTDNVEGSIAECGCYTGASAYFIAEAAPDTPIYLFDSFEGLSDPGHNDYHNDIPSTWKRGDMAMSEDVLRRNLSRYTNIHILKGWIPERFHEVSELKFRFVHIDVDLYQPTLDCLNFFYPRLPDRGVIVLDDYGFTNCAGAYKATQDFIADKPEKILSLTTGQGIIIRGL